MCCILITLVSPLYSLIFIKWNTFSHLFESEKDMYFLTKKSRFDSKFALEREECLFERVCR